MHPRSGGVFKGEDMCDEAITKDADYGNIVGLDPYHLGIEGVSDHDGTYAITNEDDIGLLEGNPNGFLVDSSHDPDHELASSKV